VGAGAAPSSSNENGTLSGLSVIPDHSGVDLTTLAPTRPNVLALTPPQQRRTEPSSGARLTGRRAEVIDCLRACDSCAESQSKKGLRSVFAGSTINAGRREPPLSSIRDRGVLHVRRALPNRPLLDRMCSRGAEGRAR
jgi:hypothetical protein